MPHIVVDSSNPSIPSSGVRLKYEINGCGRYRVVFIAGMCVPRSMWDAQVQAMVYTGEFSVLTLDNRGVGESDAPAVGWFSSGGYTVERMAKDVWEVVDAVGWSEGPEVALVGHSMGGMIAQRMCCLRPRRVTFLGLLSTHGGGWYHCLPTWTMMKGMAKLLYNRFDEEVNAHVNLDFHFTNQFLEEIIIVKGKNREEKGGALKRRRREVYFERYVGREIATESAEEDESAVLLSSGGDDSEKTYGARLVRAAEKESTNALYGHTIAVLRHQLTVDEAQKIRDCRRIRTLVMYGSDDCVVSPVSSRTLSESISANQEVLLPGRHFITDEFKRIVNYVLIGEIDAAYNRSAACHCEWCGSHEEEPPFQKDFSASVKHKDKDENFLRNT